MCYRDQARYSRGQTNCFEMYVTMFVFVVLLVFKTLEAICSKQVEFYDVMTLVCINSVSSKP